ncbi:MAG: TonB-dependent receptor, partial [Amphiplicatus sp.]
LAEWDAGSGTLTSVTAWRFWDWDPASDRDFLGLPITTISANPSKQRQYTQELRYASMGGNAVDYVIGLFAYHQTIDSTGLQEQGAAAARWLLAPAPENTPELLDGLRAESDIAFSNTSLAAFGQATWNVTDRFRLLPGVRFNWDKKDADYSQTVSGGLDTDDPALIARKNAVLASQSYVAHFDDFNVSGQITASWDVADDIGVFATYARSFKSGGVNLGGIPNDAEGNPALSLASIAPEDERHYEAGVKSQFFNRALTINVAAFQTDIRDYQAQVMNASVGVLRGYLANADKVRVRGIEIEADARLTDRLSVYGSAAFTDGEYVSFPDAPCPLELTGGPSQACDISGTALPGVSRWAASFGGQYAVPASIAGIDGEAYFGADASYRSSFSSSATSSAYLAVDGYALANFRAGFRADNDWEIFIWARNAFDENYYEFLSAQPGGSGLYVGQVGDPRTWGVTLKARL